MSNSSAYLERGRTKLYVSAPNCHYLPQVGFLKHPKVQMLFHVDFFLLSSADLPVQGFSVYRTLVVPWCQSCQTLAANDRQPVPFGTVG